MANWMALAGSKSVIETRTSGVGEPATSSSRSLARRRHRNWLQDVKKDSEEPLFREGVEVQGQSVCLSELKYVIIPHTRAYYVIDGIKARKNFFFCEFCCRLGWIGKTLQSMYTSVTFAVRHWIKSGYFGYKWMSWNFRGEGGSWCFIRWGPSNNFWA